MKDYELIIKYKKSFLFFYYTKKIKLLFNQAKVINILKFLNDLEKKDFNLNIWIWDFIKQYSTKRISNKELEAIYLNWDKIFEQIKNTYFKWIFKWNKTKNTNYSPISSLLSFICKEWWVNGYDLLYKMTWDDIMLFAEWGIWNLNEQTKKWKKLNRLKIIEKKAEKRSEQEKEEIRQKLKLLSNK